MDMSLSITSPYIVAVRILMQYRIYIDVEGVRNENHSND